ncbi:hypothetical protein Tco_1353975 [Tanacetum coccineum]
MAVHVNWLQCPYSKIKKNDKNEVPVFLENIFDIYLNTPSLSLQRCLENLQILHFWSCRSISESASHLSSLKFSYPNTSALI